MLLKVLFLSECSCFYNNLDLYGPDVKVILYAATIYDCRKECQLVANCQFFVFKKSSDHNCFLKASNTPGNLTDNNSITGLKNCPQGKPLFCQLVPSVPKFLIFSDLCSKNIFCLDLLCINVSSLFQRVFLQPHRYLLL